jgi:nicotinamide riboside transporter PnuC
MEKIPLFLAIATGAFIGCFGIALATVFLQELFLQSILLCTAAVMVIIVITLIGWFSWKGYRKRIDQ